MSQTTSDKEKPEGTAECLLRSNTFRHAPAGFSSSRIWGRQAAAASRAQLDGATAEAAQKEAHWAEIQEHWRERLASSKEQVHRADVDCRGWEAVWAVPRAPSSSRPQLQ